MRLSIGSLHSEKNLTRGINPDRLTIGRAPVNSVQLDDDTVSSVHAEIVCIGQGKYLLRDLGSKNGTYVDGLAISEAEILGPCKIAFGAVPVEILEGDDSNAGSALEAAESQADLIAKMAGESEKLRAQLSSASAQWEGERQSLVAQIAGIGKENENRLRTKQELCDSLSREFDELKSAHGLQIERERGEHSAQLGKADQRYGERLREKDEKCGVLASEIDDLRHAQALAIEMERREYSAQIDDFERRFEAASVGMQEKCAALIREMEELKKGHGLQVEQERREHALKVEQAEKKCESRVKEVEEKCSALNRAIETLRKKRDSQIESQQKDHSAEVEPKPAECPNPSLATSPTHTESGHVNRGKIRKHMGSLLCVGFLGFGLCLIAQTSSPSVLQTAGPSNAVASLDATRVSSEGETEAPAKVATTGGKEVTSVDRENGNGEPGERGLNAPPSDPTVAEAATSDPSPSNSGVEAPVDRVQPTNLDEAKVLRVASQVAGLLCPCVTGEFPESLNAKTVEQNKLPEIAEGPATDAAGAPIQDQAPLEQSPTDIIPQDQSAPADAAQGTDNPGTVGFKLQEEEKSAPANASAAPQLKDAIPSHQFEPRNDSGAQPPLVNESRTNEGRRSLDQVKNDAPPSLSKALLRKNSPAGPAANANSALRVLILGDSLSLCGFGKKLDQDFRADPQVKAVFSYMACGVNPLSWIKEKPYANVKTHCGFWSIESSAGQPTEVEDVYGMRQGYVPKPHPVPKVEDLLQTVHPDVLIMQCGTNLFELFLDRTTVNPEKDGQKVRKYIAPFLNAARQCPTLKKIYWVAPPTSGRTSAEIQDFVFNQIRTCASEIASVIDSRTLVAYPYHQMEPDHEHFIGADMNQWADGVFSFVKQDFCTQPFATMPAIAQAVPPEEPKTMAKADDAAQALYVRGKLAFKSPPIPLKQLLPYQESLVGYVYDVSQVVAGKYEEKQILVLHPACIGLKPQPLEKYKMGKMYKLRLRELESTPWHTVKSQDESGRIDLIPYIQIEDEKRFPGTSH